MSQSNSDVIMKCNTFKIQVPCGISHVSQHGIIFLETRKFQHCTTLLSITTLHTVVINTFYFSVFMTCSWISWKKEASPTNLLKNYQTSVQHMNTAYTSHCWKIPRNLSQENKDTCAWLIAVDHIYMNISMLCATIIIIINISQMIKIKYLAKKGYKTSELNNKDCYVFRVFISIYIWVLQCKKNNT